jgi:hypothetical protein
VDGEATVTEVAEPQLEAAALQDATIWLEHYRQFRDASWSRLDEHLREIEGQANGKESPPDDEGGIMR